MISAKKVSLHLLSLCLGVIVAFPVFASGSGACSSHGGVNCGFGADIDGSVICNDSWRDSSVLYSNVLECQQVTTKYCPPPIPSQYTTMSQCSSLTVQQNISGASMYAPQIAQGNISGCQNQVSEYQAQVAAYQACLSQSSSNNYSYTAPSALSVTPDATCQKQFGSASKASSSKPGYCVCFDNFVFGANDQCILGNSYCVEKMGEGAIYDSELKTCACNSNAHYLLNNGVCVGQNKYCIEKFGIESFYSSKTQQCQCNNNFQLNDTKDRCIYKTQPLSGMAISPAISTSTTLSTVTTDIVQLVPLVTSITKKFITTQRRINVRLTPSSKAKIIGVTTIKKQYELLEQNNVWVKVKYDKKVGWIMKNLVAITK